MKRLASAMSILSSIGIVVVVLVGPVVWLFHIDQIAAWLGPSFPAIEFPLHTRLAGAVVALAGGALRAYGLLGIRRTFLEAREGRPLSQEAVVGFRRLARVELAMVFVAVIQNSIYSIILSVDDPRTGPSLSIEIGTSQVAALFFAVLLVFAAEVFAEGKRAADENAQIL